MAHFKAFIGAVVNGDTGKGVAPMRLREDVACRNFREARATALASYKEKRNSGMGLVALVLCDDYAMLIAAGIRPASVRNFGNGYAVDVTPSQAQPEVPPPTMPTEELFRSAPCA